MIQKENLSKIKNKLDNNVEIVAVSKTKTVEEIMQIYNLGHRNFGENKVQEIVEKQKILPKDINWHFIGHLQRNKVKMIVGFVHLIHSVDSLKLLDEINKRATKEAKTINCLIQIKIAKEENKYGFDINEIDSVLEYAKNLKNVNIKGFMGMSTFTENQEVIENEFSSLKKVFDDKKSHEFRILSMGMSNDYEVAVKNGSNMIRLGSIIFGKRI